METTVPDSVLKSLKENPNCSLSVTESSTFTQRKEAEMGEEVLERKYFLSCPSKPARLLHSEISKRQISGLEQQGSDWMGGRAGAEMILREFFGRGFPYPPGVASEQRWPSAMPHHSPGTEARPRHPTNGSIAV